MCRVYTKDSNAGNYHFCQIKVFRNCRCGRFYTSTMGSNELYHHRYPATVSHCTWLDLYVRKRHPLAGSCIEQKRKQFTAEHYGIIVQLLLFPKTISGWFSCSCPVERKKEGKVIQGGGLKCFKPNRRRLDGDMGLSIKVQ